MRPSKFHAQIELSMEKVSSSWGQEWPYDVHQAAVHVPETSDDSDVHHPLLGESDAVDLDLSFSDLSLGDVSLTTLLESLDTESKDFFQTLRSSSSTWRRLLCMGILFTVGLSRKTSHKNMLTVFLRNSLVLY